MVLTRSFGHGHNGKIAFIVFAVTMIIAILFGCAHRGDIHLSENVADKTIVDIADSVSPAKIFSSEELIAKLERVRAEHEERFGYMPPTLKFDHVIGMDTLSAEEQILLIEHHLRYDYSVSKRGTVDWLEFRRIEYEARFGRNPRSIICKYADGVCQGPLPQLASCSGYKYELVENALKYNTPILEDTIIVTRLDLWISEYCGGELQTCSFPSWLQEYSDEDKIILLEFAIRRPKDTFGPNVNQIMIGRSYLSNDIEDSIKTTLGKIIAEQKKRLGRDMTELEIARAEFELQYLKAVPDCEQCTDEEFLAILRFMIRMNTPYIMRVNRDRVESLIKRINNNGNSRMTASEMIATELEFFAGNGKRINCPQCSDDELYLVAKYYEKMFGDIPDPVSNSLLDSLKNKREEKRVRCR